MLTSRGRFGEKWVVHVTKLVGPLVPAHVERTQEPVKVLTLLDKRENNQ